MTRIEVDLRPIEISSEISLGTTINSNMASGGARGYSAYEIWLQEGNTGSEQVFLESLRGDGVVTYVHDQILASEVWEINHNLGFYPLVDVIDSGGTLVIGEVHHVDTDNLILTFSAPFSGKALIK